MIDIEKKILDLEKERDEWKRKFETARTIAIEYSYATPNFIDKEIGRRLKENDTNE